MLLLLDRDWAVLSELDIRGELAAAWLIAVGGLGGLWFA